MTEKPFPIDKIVGEVVRQISLVQRQMSSEAPPSKEPLYLSSQVVGLTDLKNRLGQVQTIYLRPDAIVTPAARDLLREKKIAIVFKDPDRSQIDLRPPLLIGWAETSFVPLDLLYALARDGAPTQSIDQHDIVTVVEHLVPPLQRNANRGLLLTGEPLPSCCLANRHQGVRAAVVRGFLDVDQAVKTLGANLLIVDPADKSLSQLVRLVRAFRDTIPHNCPAQYRNQLT